MGVTVEPCDGRQYGYVTCTVVSGSKTSTAADLEGFLEMGLVVPTIDSGNLTFTACETADGTYRTVKTKNGSAFSITAGTGNACFRAGVNKFLEPFRFVKIVCAATQNADRTFTWIVKA